MHALTGVPLARSTIEAHGSNRTELTPQSPCIGALVPHFNDAGGIDIFADQDASCDHGGAGDVHNTLLSSEARHLPLPTRLHDQAQRARNGGYNRLPRRRAIGDGGVRYEPLARGWGGGLEIRPSHLPVLLTILATAFIQVRGRRRQTAASSIIRRAEFSAIDVAMKPIPPEFVRIDVPFFEYVIGFADAGVAVLIAEVENLRNGFKRRGRADRANRFSGACVRPRIARHRGRPEHLRSSRVPPGEVP